MGSWTPRETSFLYGNRGNYTLPVLRVGCGYPQIERVSQQLDGEVEGTKVALPEFDGGYIQFDISGLCS